MDACCGSGLANASAASATLASPVRREQDHDPAGSPSGHATIVWPASCADREAVAGCPATVCRTGASRSATPVRAVLVEVMRLAGSSPSPSNTATVSPDVPPSGHVAPANRTPSMPASASVPSAASVQLRPESTVSGPCPRTPPAAAPRDPGRRRPSGRRSCRRTPGRSSDGRRGPARGEGRRRARGRVTGARGRGMGGREHGRGTRVPRVPKTRPDAGRPNGATSLAGPMVASRPWLDGPGGAAARLTIAAEVRDRAAHCPRRDRPYVVSAFATHRSRDEPGKPGASATGQRDRRPGRLGTLDEPGGTEPAITSRVTRANGQQARVEGR